MTESIEKEQEAIKQTEALKRDGETSIAVGLFVLALAIPVLLGTFWALDRPRAAVVNFIAGFVLFLIGGGATAYGWSLFKRSKQPGA